MDIDLSPLLEERVKVLKKKRPKNFPIPHTGIKLNEELPVQDSLSLDEVAKRAERRRKRGVKVRVAFGEIGGAYIYDLGEYRKKKVKVWVQYEGYSPNAVAAERRQRLAITLPAAWVDFPIRRVKEIFLEAYNAEHKDFFIDPKLSFLAKTDEISYVNFAKHIFTDDNLLIGDTLYDHEELFILTQDDIDKLHAEIEGYQKEIDDIQQAGMKYQTIDIDTALALTPLFQDDPSLFRVVLVGMLKAFVIPVEPHYTIADLKAFIHYKAGPDVYPLGSLDMAFYDQQDNALNVLPDSLTFLDLAKQLDLDLNTIPKPCVPVHWGKRLQDPRFFFWVPTLHTPESFRAPSDISPEAAAAAANKQAASGGGDEEGASCTIS